MEEILEVNGNRYRLKIHMDRRRYSRASVNRNSINIRIPSFMPESWKRGEIEKLKQWAVGKIITNPKKFSQPKHSGYENGQKIKIIGREFILKISEEERIKFFTKLSGNEIEIRIPKGKHPYVGKIISKMISKEFLGFLKERTVMLNNIYFHKNIGKIVMKNNKSTWGSCSPRGDVTIATKLLLAPVEIIDYVIIHELAHLVVRGHSKKFWQAVEKAMPDYKERRKWLRKNGDSCIF